MAYYSESNGSPLLEFPFVYNPLKQKKNDKNVFNPVQSVCDNNTKVLFILFANGKISKSYLPK